MSVRGNANEPRGWNVVTMTGIVLKSGFATALDAHKAIRDMAREEVKHGGRQAGEDLKARLTVVAA